MDTYTIRNMSKNVRCRWVYDAEYQTRGSYGYDTEEETREAEEQELAALERGELVTLGCIVEKRCDKCGEWKDDDSLWGIVIQPNDGELDSFARDAMDLS